MRQVVQTLSDGVVQVVDVPQPVLRPHGVVVATQASLISAGTERAKLVMGKSSLLEKARRRPDDVRKVLDRVRRDGVLATYRFVKDRLDAWNPLGYSSAGIALECGELVEGIRAGDRVACAGAGFANHAEIVYVPSNLCVRVPDAVSTEAAAYSTVGSIAMQGFRQSGAVVGDAVGIIGLGLVGQLTAQIASAAGCHVFGVDIDAHKANGVLGHGAEAVATGQSVGTAAETFTEGRGLDAVIVTASSRGGDPLALAAAIARDRAVVVVVGDVRIDVPRKELYEKELQLRLSRSYGPGRYDPAYEEYGLDYPIGYVRWTEKRNMEEFLAQIARGAVDVARLTTHRYRIEDAAQAYAVLEDESAQAVGIVLEYPSAEMIGEQPIVAPPATSRPGPVADGIAFLGVGNYATGVLLPALRSAGSLRLTAVASAGGASASDAARRFGFQCAVSGMDELMADAETGSVVIATRHSSHAEMAARALRAGRHVLVEKPLALTREELDEVVAAWCQSTADLMVGFNRRFAPLTRTLIAERRAAAGPAIIGIRVNAGRIPPDHWIQQPDEGGGRILGEMCHFVDLAEYIAGAQTERVRAAALGNGKSALLQDTLIAVLEFADGSVASITYAAEGDTSFPKERVEVFVGRRALVIDDFHTASVTSGGRTREEKLPSLDKGQKGEMKAFLAMTRGEPNDVCSFASAVSSTCATLAVVEALAKGQTVTVVRPRL